MEAKKYFDKNVSTTPQKIRSEFDVENFKTRQGFEKSLRVRLTEWKKARWILNETKLECFFHVFYANDDFEIFFLIFFSTGAVISNNIFQFFAFFRVLSLFWVFLWKNGTSGVCTARHRSHCLPGEGSSKSAQNVSRGSGCIPDGRQELELDVQNYATPVRKRFKNDSFSTFEPVKILLWNEIKNVVKGLKILFDNERPLNLLKRT